jgi:hypothetical protein
MNSLLSSLASGAIDKYPDGQTTTFDGTFARVSTPPRLTWTENHRTTAASKVQNDTRQEDGTINSISSSNA